MSYAGVIIFGILGAYVLHLAETRPALMAFVKFLTKLSWAIIILGLLYELTHR